MIKIWDNATLVALVEGCLSMQTEYSALLRVSLLFDTFSKLCNGLEHQ